MRILFNIIILTAISLICYGWVAVEQTDQSIAHPGYCYSNTKGVGSMERGEIKMKDGECVKIVCGEGGLIHYYGCGSNPILPSCKIDQAGDLSKFYPDCCSNITC